MTYLDNNATTPIAPSVLEAMLPFLKEQFGNPSSTNRMGRIAKNALEDARLEIANLLGCLEEEIVFTSGATEAISLAIRGAIAERPHAPRRIVTTKIEHSAVLKTCRSLAWQGYEIDEIPVRANGQLDLEYATTALSQAAALASIMWANNETGVIFPIAELAEIAHAQGTPFHTDAAQAIGKFPLDLAECNVDLLSLGGHKFHAPKGTGALFVRQGFRVTSQMNGGQQERGMRAGTENVAGMVGLGEACRLLSANQVLYTKQMLALRDYLEGRLKTDLPDILIYGEHAERIPNTSMVGIPGIDQKHMLQRLEQNDVIVSSQSACNSQTLEPSHVLHSMGVTSNAAKQVIRISLSRFNTRQEIDHAVSCIVDIARAFQTISFPPTIC